MLLPLLSERDDATAGEGSLDPLGLAPIGDRLAARLVPGVTERQSHPRFLTIYAVSLNVCDTFDDDLVAKDGISPPWQVFEWYVVEGLVRSARDRGETSGLAGSDKARSAIADGMPLSSKRYLKSPSVFGFHGVYRLLARTLGVEHGGFLGEFGTRLLRAWSEDQRLPGFSQRSGVEGATWLDRLRKTVADGLETGAVARKNWDGWQFFGDHLSIYKAGASECQTIWQALLEDAQGFRRQILEFLISPAGSLEQNKADHGGYSERRFHANLKRTSRPDLIALLECIAAYERFSRLLQDAFDDCLHGMTQTCQWTPPAQLYDLPCVARAASELRELYPQVRDRLAPYELSIRFEESFRGFEQPLSPAGFFNEFLEHHRRVQKRKPPAGKAAWFEQGEDGCCFVRPAYRLDEGGRHDDEYVHAYRTNSLWSFARDLKKV